jgi:hypothetical protein
MKIKHVIEGLKDPKDNPCWKGYKPVGTKKKNGKTVPNCVPKESVEEGYGRYYCSTDKKWKERKGPKQTRESVAEGSEPNVEEFFQKVAQEGDYDMLYDAQMGKYGKEIERAVQDMYDNVSINSRMHPDDDFEEIYDRMLDMIEDDYGVVGEENTAKVTDIKPGDTATIDTGTGVTTTVDLKKNPTALTKDPESGKLKLTTNPMSNKPPEQGGDSAEQPIKPGDEIELATEAETSETNIPPMPDITGLQPGQSKDLGDGEAVTLNRDSTVSLSGGFGTIVYSSQGKPLKYMLPRMGGLGKTIDLTTNKATTSYNAGPMNITQGPDGEVDAEYDFGTAKAKMSRDAQGKTTSSLTARESADLEAMLRIAGLK